MRGIFFKSPIEYKLEISGDEWHQGETISGSLTIKNRGSESHDCSKLDLSLSEGITKKVKTKSEGSLTSIASANLTSLSEVPAGEELKISWQFELDDNCMVTDKGQSLYLVLREEFTIVVGHLQLNILPHPHLEAAVMLMENSFSFVFKGYKSKMGWVESKFSPPSGIAYPTLETLLLSMRLADDYLNINYKFKVKNLSATSSTLDVKKGQLERKQQILCRDYLFPGGLINHDPLENVLREGLDAVRSKM